MSLEEKLDNRRQCLYWYKENQKAEPISEYTFFNNPCSRCTGYKTKCELYYNGTRIKKN